MNNKYIETITHYKLWDSDLISTEPRAEHGLWGDSGIAAMITIID